MGKTIGQIGQDGIRVAVIDECIKRMRAKQATYETMANHTSGSERAKLRARRAALADMVEELQLMRAVMAEVDSSAAA